MFVDARRLSSDALIDTEVCIIGAGAAGISLAHALIGQPFRVSLLESGGLRFDRATQSLYSGENTGLPYEPIDESRSRYFGGSTNCWGGWNRPLSDLDFERRDWIPFSGWPLTRSELNPYYERAHRLCELGPLRYDPEYWEAALGAPHLRLLPLVGGRVVSTISQFSPPTRFGKVYRADIKRAANITTYLYANALELETDHSAQMVTRLRAGTLAGNRFSVRACYFVLATGGIENARLLLSSNSVHSAGLGNTHDLVGRFFMEHPRLRSGVLYISAPRTPLDLYDLTVNYRNPHIAAFGTSVAAHLTLRQDIQIEERLLNTSISVRSIYAGEESESAEAFKELYRAIRRGALLRRKLPRPLFRRVARAFTRLDTVVTAVYGRLFRPRALLRMYRLDTVVEPAPNPDSRVSLSGDRDRLGLNRARVHWALDPLVKRTFRRSHEILDEELRRSGLGSVSVEVSHDDPKWPPDLQWCWHHIGTTRMHPDPKQGVVDEHCRVHGIANLFIAGSSVFPTAGNDTPTLTIVALALRLAERIKSLFRGSAHDATGSAPGSPGRSPGRSASSADVTPDP